MHIQFLSNTLKKFHIWQMTSYKCDLLCIYFLESSSDDHPEVPSCQPKPRQKKTAIRSKIRLQNTKTPIISILVDKGQNDCNLRPCDLKSNRGHLNVKSSLTKQGMNTACQNGFSVLWNHVSVFTEIYAGLIYIFFSNNAFCFFFIHRTCNLLTLII